MRRVVVAGVGLFFLTALVVFVACSKGSSTSSSSDLPTRAINSDQTTVGTVTTAYGGSCTKVTRDTSSCQSARTTLGLSGDWLSFSCNVVLGLATSGLASTTTYSSASYVTVKFVGLPDHTSNYYPTSGSYSFTANSYTVTGTYN